MRSRREEKFILDYRIYSLVKSRVSSALRPDIHYINGSYTVTSLYFDDFYKTAYYEKADGLSAHTKFRIRTYDFSDDFIRLEKKKKNGIVTSKSSLVISKDELRLLMDSPFTVEGFSEKLMPLAAEMQSKGVRPAVTVRYRREAFFLEGTDVRVTFDTRVESVPGDMDSLFNDKRQGIPAINPISVIMEIKYGNKLPTLIRRLCCADVLPLSVSKYALCTENIRLPAGKY
ncbi:MAG: polyphosphate polymerase domain-containing protein [Eubacteriales bacterium]|mgnify:FL=1|nr:polyphosphate polymerase domain-containing protein [Eubacteriales bacterium]MDD4421790.1 polyphosphate polymerase domain-containing protein [Eubacteriales bacterium]HBR32492.1 hypothetical protein [Clostridiales bacterium]